MRLYLIWIVTLVVLLLFGPDSARVLAVIILAFGAWPLHQMINQEGEAKGIDRAASFIRDRNESV